MLGWSAWSLTESAFWVGLVSAAMLLPTFVLSPVFGVIADRINLRTGLLCTTLSQALVGSLAGLAFFSGWLSIELLVVLSMVKGMVTAAHQPMRLSMMPRLIDRSLLPSGIGLSAMMFNASRVVGPAAGAGLLALSSTGWVFGASALLFSLAAGLLFRLPLLAPQSSGVKKSIARDLGAGLKFAANHPAIRLILLLAFLNGIHGRALIELLPALSGQMLNGNANTLAFLTALAGLGSIVGGVVMAQQRGSERRLLRLVYLALLLGSCVLLPVLVFHQLVAISIIIFLLSLCLTVTGTGCQALVQLVVENEYRGRVLSLWTVIAMGAPAIGAFFMGVLADGYGFAPVLVGFSLVVIAVTLLLMPYRSALY